MTLEALWQTVETGLSEAIRLIRDGVPPQPGSVEESTVRDRIALHRGCAVGRHIVGHGSSFLIAPPNVRTPRQLPGVPDGIVVARSGAA